MRDTWRRSHLVLHAVSISLALFANGDALVVSLSTHPLSSGNANAACSTVVLGAYAHSLAPSRCPPNTLAASVRGVKYFDHLALQQAAAKRLAPYLPTVLIILL